jgi:hypothetical protein
MVEYFEYYEGTIPKRGDEVLLGRSREYIYRRIYPAVALAK